MIHKHGMQRLDKITPDWIKEQLGNSRGGQARLAEALGVKPDIVTKIVSGNRRVQPAELAVILEFLGYSAVAITEEEEDLLKLFHSAPQERRGAVEVLLKYQAPQQDKP